MSRGAGFQYFRRNPIVIGSKYDRWRGVAGLLELSVEERLRVEWMIFYYRESGENAVRTCGHFGISRKTFHKWINRFKRSKQDVASLKDISRRPHKVRGWQVSLTQEIRIKQLRSEHMHYGKKKLKVLYEKKYNEEISCWKIERVIRKHKLHPDRKRQEKIARKQAISRARPKKRIFQLRKENRLWFLFQMDTIVIYWGNIKRYILTAVDHASKLGYARMYKTKSSKVASDFLYRLNYLVEHQIENIQTDNGSEFYHYFQRATNKLNIKRYFSRVKTPKDNPEIERFNQTLEYEWMYDGNLDSDCDTFNKNLTSWLIEYNFHRPHQSLDYLTPIEYVEKELGKTDYDKKVLPMCSVSTLY